jgi:biotin operon repressor
MLGASREAVNKHLRALAREGCIAVAGHKIEIYKTPRTDIGAA